MSSIRQEACLAKKDAGKALKNRRQKIRRYTSHSVTADFLFIRAQTLFHHNLGSLRCRVRALNDEPVAFLSPYTQRDVTCALVMAEVDGRCHDGLNANFELLLL